MTKDMQLITLLFVCLGIGEQLSNGLLQTNFAIMDLLSIYGIVAAYYGINFGIASKWNSIGGMSPPMGYSRDPINTQGGKR
ncbi:hypothetical protein SPFL3102_03588 [Sporomusaceae bacterium FL31]|nr:hypothetical protein SPFL3101_00417 [Sporomusaceae bacterium FL31]GCE35737.1 hypothetical protein SPFL3102_03588 [Sporomusaceae bacterium]